MNIGKRILTLLEEQGISQQEFAKRLHVNYNTANGYINNRRLPDCETILRMSELLNASTDYIIGRTDIRYSKDLTYAKEEGILLNYYRGLTPDMRRMLVEVSKCLYESQRKENEKQFWRK